MAWTANIVQKGIVDKSFIVGVSYTNGSIQFVEQVDMTGGTLQALSDRVASRLATLETTVALIPQVTPGPFIPTPATPQLTAAQIAFITAFNTLRRAKQAVDIGLIANTDTTYVNALTAAQAAYDPAFLTLVF